MERARSITKKIGSINFSLLSPNEIRKMSATDSQDPVAGQDLIYDDAEGFLQKISPTRYPYEYRILEEREYLTYLRPT